MNRKTEDRNELLFVIRFFRFFCFVWLLTRKRYEYFHFSSFDRSYSRLHFKIKYARYQTKVTSELRRNKKICWDFFCANQYSEIEYIACHKSLRIHSRAHGSSKWCWTWQWKNEKKKIIFFESFFFYFEMDSLWRS